MSTAPPVYYRDAGNRSVTDEEIALRWIRAHPQLAAQAIGRAPLAQRRFAIQGKATPDGRVEIGKASDDDGG